MTTVLTNPLILSFSSIQTFGFFMSVASCRMVLGSIVMSIWEGGKKSVFVLFIFSALNGIALIIAGIKPSISIITFGLSLSFFTIPIIWGTNEGSSIGFLIIVEGLVLIITSIILYNYFSFKQFNIELVTDDSVMMNQKKIEVV